MIQGTGRNVLVGCLLIIDYNTVASVTLAKSEIKTTVCEISHAISCEISKIIISLNENECYVAIISMPNGQP